MQNEWVSISLELKSYNNRYLDLFVNLPSFLSPLEPRVRETVAVKVQRGRIEVTLKVKELEEDVRIFLDSSSAKAYAGALEELSRIVGIEERIHLSHLLKMDGILKTEKNRNLELYWSVLEPVLSVALEEFETSRIREGASTETDILSNLELLELNLGIVEKNAPELERYIKDNLYARFTEMLGESVDESRVYAETAVLLVKYSINEEIVRLRSHLDSFKMTTSESGSIGRKLDFICQEINREVNTIGSKSFLIEVNQAVIEMKDALEKIREQLRNVE